MVLAYLLWNQLQVRPARTRQTFPIVLVVVGAATFYSYAKVHPLSVGAEIAIGASLLLLALGLGAVRAYTVKLWMDGSQLMRQGTLVTAALWIVGLGLHLALERAVGAAAASDVLYLGLTLLAQRLVLQSRMASVST